jgi:acetylornithine/N-succinyldiaminopimelate aminotransferase
VQGEGGITPATPEYLLGLRALCDERKMLLMMDAVQCGHFRTGRYQSFQRILEGVPDGEKFLPDAVSMAKALGGGFPIGAFWVREPHQDLLGAGTHGTTFGGTPLACAVALKVFDVIERDHLADNARNTGEFLKSELHRLAAAHPNTIKSVRGLGFLLGLELNEKERIPSFAGNEKAASIQFVNRLHDAGMLTIPSGTQVIRLLPPLNLTRNEAAEAVALIESVLRSL